MKTIGLLLFTVVGSSAATLAQTVTLAVAQASTVTAQLGGAQQVVPVPAGSLPSAGVVNASTSVGNGYVAADLSWSLYADDHAMEVRLMANCGISGAGATAAHASVAPTELLVTITNPTPMPLSFQLSRLVSGPAGDAIPLTRIDVLDDGFDELTENSPDTIVPFYAVAGPSPLVIRCTLGADATVDGSLFANLFLSIRPGDTLTSVVQSGCAGDGFVTLPRFDGNLDYEARPGFDGTSVAVFGLTTQPLFLGAQVAYPGGPLQACLLVPRPDLLVFLPTLDTHTLVVPPAARPIELYVQAVRFGGPVLATSSAFQLTAF
ncbi:MAG: hypothetical protein H6835_16570 [Planctomycetes bacterium]|nr:hypothetical protein [Planctomycetota bacterium]